MNHAVLILGLITLLAGSGCDRPEPAATETPFSEPVAKVPPAAPALPPVDPSTFITASGMRFILASRDHYAAAWRHVAKRYADNATVIGYDLMNEPFPGSLMLQRHLLGLEPALGARTPKSRRPR